MLVSMKDSLVFCDIDATEYLDDLWGRHGLHLHVNISKFEEVRSMHMHTLHLHYVLLHLYLSKPHLACTVSFLIIVRSFRIMLSVAKIGNI